MRLFRSLTAAAASSLLVATAFTGPATAAAAGVGTALSSTKVLTAQLGDAGQILDLTLLSDEARSTIDKAVANPEAYTRITALNAKTAISPANILNSSLANVGTFEAKSSGPSSVDIGPAIPALPTALAPVLAGTVNSGKLTATLTDGTAASGLNLDVANLRAVGGLLALDSVKSVLDATSAASASSASRGVSVTNVTVLDLGALLQGLGVSLPDLTVAQLVALVDQLAAATGLPLPSGQTTLAGAVALIQSAIDAVQATITTDVSGNVTSVTGLIDSSVAGVLSTIGVSAPLPTTTGAGAAVIALAQAVIDQVQAQLDNLVAEGLRALDNLSLLRLEGVEVSVSTKAVDTVEGSSATVVGKVGKVFVGNIELPGIDLAAAAATVSGTVEAINTKIASVLSLISPDLANLVKVSVLDQATSVTQSGGYTRSRAGVTAATATVTPPAILAEIVRLLTSQVNAVKNLVPSSTIASLGLTSAMNDLGGTLNLATSALTSPAKVQIASVLSASDFARAGAITSAPGNTLPRTGGPAGLAILGGLAAIVAVSIRRFMTSPAMRTVRIDK